MGKLHSHPGRSRRSWVCGGDNGVDPGVRDGARGAEGEKAEHTGGQAGGRPHMELEGKWGLVLGIPRLHV